jgi:hypothetical protein
MTGDRGAIQGRMEGGGFYTAHSDVQAEYGELGFQWLEQAAAEVVPPRAPLPFAIADMGAAGGGNSLEPMARALAARRGQAPALVIHTDIPDNDFSALFRLVQSAPGSYLQAPETYALAAGRSFFEPLLPEGFLSLGWSSIAVHWLSAVPRPIPDHIYCSFATGAAREALAARSAQDWTAFLDHRARELRPSGRLVVVGGAALDDGRSGAEGLMAIADAALRELVAHGDLADDEYARMTIPTWNRTRAEFLAPFQDGSFDGRLELRRDALRTLPDPHLAELRQDGDVGRFATATAGFFRAAFAESLWASLAPGDTQRRAHLADRFERLLRDGIAAAPEDAACSWHVVVLDIARTGD